MNRKHSVGFLAGAVAMGGMLFSLTASANLINITTSDLPPGITALDGNVVAMKTSSQGDTQLLDWLKGQVSLRPGYEEPGDLIRDSGNTITGIDLSEWGGEYLVVHWGNGPANQLFPQHEKPNGGFDQVFFISREGDNSSLSLDLPYLQSGNRTEKVGGLSFWRVYDPVTNSVPDAGATVGLLGLAACLVQVARARWMKR